MGSYVIYSVIVALLGTSLSANEGLRIPPPNIVFSKFLTDPKSPLDFIEIFWATIIAVFLGLLISYLHHRKLLHKFAEKFNITTKFGDPNVWSFVLNIKDIRWAVVRDMENNLMFQGYIRVFSDVEETAELVLTDVVVYNETTGKELYKADTLYLARKRDNLTVEFPSIQDTGGSNGK